jgi:hypothetical protein
MCLHPCRNSRLDRERIGQEGEQGREVRQREQPIRIATRVAAREPGLQQRARRRQEEKRQTERDGQQPQDQRGGIFTAGRFPERARNDRQRKEARHE